MGFDTKNLSSVCLATDDLFEPFLMFYLRGRESVRGVARPVCVSSWPYTKARQRRPHLASQVIGDAMLRVLGKRQQLYVAFQWMYTNENAIRAKEEKLEWLCW